MQTGDQSALIRRSVRLQVVQELTCVRLHVLKLGYLLAQRTQPQLQISADDELAYRSQGVIFRLQHGSGDPYHVSSQTSAEGMTQTGERFADVRDAMPQDGASIRQGEVFNLKNHV